MKRLKRRFRSTSKEQKDGDSWSLSCLPGSLWRRGLPPPSPPQATKMSPVPHSSSRPQRSTQVDEVNHIDRRALDDVDRRGENGVSSGAGLLGGSGLQHYDRFIATLLRERSLVKEGVPPQTAADQPTVQVDQSLRTTTTRLRKRRPQTDKVEGKPRINGFDTSSLEMEVKPASDERLWAKSAGEQLSSATCKGDEMSTHPISVARRRPRTEIHAGRSPMEIAETDIVGDTSMKHDRRECPPRQRQRRRRRIRRQGAAAVSEERDISATHARFKVNYKTSQKSVAVISDDSPTSQFDTVELDWLHEERVFGLTIDASTILFIDCDNQGVEPFDVDIERPVCLDQEDWTRSTLLTADRWRNTADELTVLSPSLRASSVQPGRHKTGACMRNNVHVCTVCRQSSAQRTAHPPRLHRQCRSQPSLTHSRADKVGSDFDKSVDQLTGAHRSQLLDVCRCSIAWPTTAVSPYVAETEEDMRSLQPTHGLIQSNTATTNISTLTHQLNQHPSNDVKHTLADYRQHVAVAGHFVNLPSNNVAQYVPWESCSYQRRHLTDKVSFSRRAVQVFCVLGRPLPNGHCSGKTSKCFLTIKFTLTRSQTRDQKTVLLFTQRKAAVSTAGESHQTVTGDSHVLNSPLCRGGKCSTNDVMLTITSDDNDYVINDNKQHINLARNCSTAVESLDQPSSVARSHNTSPDLVYSTMDTVHRAADVGTVCDVTSGNICDVTKSLILYEFAEVTSIFRNFADDLLPTTLSLVPYEAPRRRRDGSSSMALVRRAGPGVTYSGVVVPYGTSSPHSVALPLMAWTWNRENFAERHRQATNCDVVHIPYVSACTTVNIEPSIDHFTFIS